MREIKYKVWDKKEKEWFDSELIKLGQNGRLYFWDMGKKELQILDEDYIPVFYTGLKDKHKMDLYVGDIARFFPLEGVRFYFHGAAKVINTETGWTWEIIEQGNDFIDSTSFWNDDFEVIGNIFEDEK